MYIAYIALAIMESIKWLSCCGLIGFAINMTGKISLLWFLLIPVFSSYEIRSKNNDNYDEVDEIDDEI